MKDEVKSFNAAIDDIIETASAAEQPANLTGVVFPGDIGFAERELPESLWYGARFAAAVSYYKTTFLGDAWFTRARFSGNANFAYVRVPGAVRFTGARFSGDAIFTGAHFSGLAGFRHARFSGEAWFDNASFSGFTSFTGARFSDVAWFIGARFPGDSRFDSARFSHTADFSWSGMDDTPTKDEKAQEEPKSPGEPGVFYRLDFSGGRIEGIADFSNRTFKDVADFSGRVFGQPPKFHGAILHQGTKWRGTKFCGTDNPDAEQDYRTLRLAMENIRDRPQEGVFFALEQRAMRHQAAWWELRKWLSYGYDWACDYGRSAGQPLTWLGGLSLFFMLFYLALSGATFVDWPLIRELFEFSVQQVLKPFVIWGRGGEDLMPDFTNGLTLLFKLFATLQSLLSLGLIALFILALRWQFRRG